MIWAWRSGSARPRAYDKQVMDSMKLWVEDAGADTDESHLSKGACKRGLG